jgi:LDH2 family malate/lactate/ureidoglycolate dehydrogenase
MAEYPGTESERHFDSVALREMTASIFEACGMSPEDAHLLADSLVSADLRGIHSHGTLRVPDYVKKLTKDGVDPKAGPEVVSKHGGAIVIDGNNAMGQIAARLAMDEAIAAAKMTSIAFAGVRGSNHCGAMDYWAMRALPHGMIGICGTNALPTMAPWRGKDKMVGINPLAIAVPGGLEPPMVLDVAFGATAHGKIRVYAQKGEPIPEGWSFDADGDPTTDAEKALAGLIQPIGGHKGVGLGIMTGILSSLLSGAAYGLESGNMVDGAKPGVDGHFFIAISVEAFVSLDEFKLRADGIARSIRQSQPARPGALLYPPGLLEHRFASAYASGGIPLNAATIAGIAEAAKAFGIATTIFDTES